MEVKDSRPCWNCKKKKMEKVTTFGNGLIEGWECSGCGARIIYGEPEAKYGWPQGQVWIEKQNIKEETP